MSDSNRRRATRRMVAVPVHIDSGERKERLGITRDVSLSGTLLLSSSKFEVGERVQVTLYVSSDSNSGKKVDAEVVRVDPLPAGVHWNYAMALRFDPPLPEGDNQTFEELQDKD